MHIRNAFSLALFSTVVAVGIAVAFGLYIGVPWPKLAMMLPLALVLNYAAFYFLGRRLIFSRIRQMNERLEAGLKTRTLHVSGTVDEISKLESSLSQIVSEKTNEINALKQLERYRREFLGNVVHELRSPIFNIQGYVHTLIEGAIDDTSVSRRFLQKAVKNVDHLSSLVEDLITISKLEAGELKLERSVFDLNELVGEVIELEEGGARQRGITLSLKNGEGICPANADRKMIRQVLVNLLSNSIKYGRDNGQTTITIHQGERLLTVEVSDNGEGIAEEHLSRIFERFYRGDKNRSRGEVSTGLGLAIVKHYLEAHRQSIQATSVLGIGSIFSFTLDKANSPERPLIAVP